MSGNPDFVTVFCDDIRQEVNGKHILIGVYGKDLVPGILPQTIPLAVWINMEFPPEGRHTFKFSLVTDAGEVGVDGGFELPKSDNPSGAVLAIGPLPVNISKPGAVTAFIQFDDEPRFSVGELQVRPVPSPH